MSDGSDSINIYYGEIGSLSKYLFRAGEDLSIKTFVHDFEDAIINAVRISFVVTFHYCCWFHFKQALMGKMEDLKM